MLARVRALFLAPAPASARSLHATVAPSVAVLCRPEDALATGGALALALARDARVGRALVGVWREEPRPRRRCAPPPSPKRIASCTRWPHTASRPRRAGGSLA